MIINVLAFGIVKEIFGKPVIEIEITNNTVADLKNVLEEKYPRLKQIVSYMIAVNNEYANAENIIHQTDEVAIIPPVSGG